MKMIVLVAIFLILPNLASAWNEPDSFMGIKFGKSIGESVPKCEGDNPSHSMCWEDSYGRVAVQHAVIDNLSLVLFVDTVNDMVASVELFFFNIFLFSTGRKV